MSHPHASNYMEALPSEKLFFEKQISVLSKKKHRVAALLRDGEGDVEDNLGTQVGPKCKSCGVRNVRYVLVQTRSADEGSSAFFICKQKGCATKWSYR
jgi:DNA-directed RNA polymerase subunit M/transcription elongation factor TFIIS